MREKVSPWFGPEDYGFNMENYSHGGRTSPEGKGMGVLTIYDWGNGAAAEAVLRLKAIWADFKRFTKNAFFASRPEARIGVRVFRGRTA
jgi:hypothetical protein